MTTSKYFPEEVTDLAACQAAVVTMGARLVQANLHRRQVMEDLAEAVRAAVDAGMSISEISRSAGVQRQTTYNLLTKKPAPSDD